MLFSHNTNWELKSSEIKKDAPYRRPFAIKKFTINQYITAVELPTLCGITKCCGLMYIFLLQL